MKAVLVVFVAVAAGFLAPSAWAAADCPPVGHLPTYAASEEPEIMSYDAAPFPVKKGDDSEDVSLAGRACRQTYLPKEGSDPLSTLEIHLNFREQFKKLGAEILFADDGTTAAKLVKDGKESWIEVAGQSSEIDVTVVDKMPFKPSILPPAGNDYRLVGHMPGYVAEKPETKNFDELTFTVQDGDDTNDVTVQGAKTIVVYTHDASPHHTSNFEIQQNYRTALLAAGAALLFTDDGHTVAKIEQNGQEIWLHVASQPNEIDVAVIEEKAFHATIEPPTAAALLASLQKEKRVSLYLNFDFNKATLKPDAQPVLAQIIEMLKKNPDLKLAVEGHTDAIGEHGYNVKLSQERAAAVMAALVAGGIEAGRLSAAGYGPDKPIADNATSEGRARNRRVDLVE